MKKLIIVMAVVALTAANASAAFTETFSVDSASQTAVSSSVLANGVQYLIEVSGTWEYWNRTDDKAIADAEWWSDHADNWAWKEHFKSHDPDRHDLQFTVGGETVDWLGTTDGVNFSEHTYSPSHVYQLTVTGAGSALDFLIYDSKYSDNNGSVQVTISEIPEPATMCLLALGGLLIRKRRQPK